MLPLTRRRSGGATRVWRHAWRLAALAAFAGAVLPATSLAQAEAGTVWLCKPGLDSNPCEPGLKTTVFSAGGEALGVDRVKRTRPRTIDCFYVYPTVSEQPRTQANRRIDPHLRSVALHQAGRFSQECRVFAPVYRQVTVQAVVNSEKVTARMRAKAYADVLRAWRIYLARYNRGRGVVLIGHSQGTFWLTRLLRREIDPNRRLRRKLVSALLIGPAGAPLGSGAITVKKGRDVGGDFDRIKACRSARQLGCVVTYSAFQGSVPRDADFARTTARGREVLCTNPADLNGGSSRLQTIWATEPFAPGQIALATSLSRDPLPDVSTPWVEYRGAYGARCESNGGATALRISASPGAPRLSPIPDEGWGLHFHDVNLPLGDLTDLVRAQRRSFERRGLRAQAPALAARTRPASGRRCADGSPPCEP